MSGIRTYESTGVKPQNEAPRNEAPRSKLRGIQRNCAVANSSSFSQDETNPSSRGASACTARALTSFDALHLAIFSRAEALGKGGSSLQQATGYSGEGE
jgi:hypothetical protein